MGNSTGSYCYTKGVCGMSQQTRQTSYDQMVQQLQQTPDLQELMEQWQKPLQLILRRLKQDTQKVKMRDPGAARRLVVAAFTDALDFPEPVVVAMGSPVNEKADMLVSETIGVYPEAAFAVTAYYVADCVMVYVSTIPPGGNLR